MKKISLPLLLLSIMFSSVYSMDKSYTVIVKDLLGDNKFIKVESKDRIKDVKKKVQDVIGLLPERQKLVFNDITLKDQETIGNYGIKENNIIHVFVKLNNALDLDPKPRGGVLEGIYWGRVVAVVAVITVVVVVISSTVYYAFSYQRPKKKKEAVDEAQIEAPK